MDQMVLEVQKWLNENYQNKSGYNRIVENGRTGWSTVYALTRALQIELGISNPVNNFGTETTARYSAFGSLEYLKVPDTDQGRNIVQIFQGACWCKGYNPGGFNGRFTPALNGAILELQRDANLPVDGIVHAYIFKAFLTMDAYRLTAGGNPQIRSIQQQLNGKYFLNSGVQPCDGHYQRQTNRSLIYGLQTEIGIPAASQTGSVGPATRSGLPNLSLGSSQTEFIKLLKYALVFNGYKLADLSGSFNSEVSNVISQFQAFTLLDQSGSVNLQTWLSLLVSTGDTNRRGTSSDGITEVTTGRANTLVTNGYKIIGRYLTNVQGGLNKKIQPNELTTIFNAGLSVFPIFQESHSTARNFSFNTGFSDYQKAFYAAKEYGFPKGTTIYFAVDFDVLGHEIRDNIIPHFLGLNESKEAMGNQYNIGIYGPRNACIQVSNAGYAKTSFVSGMSTGFSGNLGFPLPQNWAFDQISTISIGSGSGRIEIDNNINSGRDNGANFLDNSVTDPGPIENPEIPTIPGEPSSPSYNFERLSYTFGGGTWYYGVITVPIEHARPTIINGRLIDTQYLGINGGFFEADNGYSNPPTGIRSISWWGEDDNSYGFNGTRSNPIERRTFISYFDENAGKYKAVRRNISTLDEALTEFPTARAVIGGSTWDSSAWGFGYHLALGRTAMVWDDEYVYLIVADGEVNIPTMESHLTSLGFNLENSMLLDGSQSSKMRADNNGTINYLGSIQDRYIGNVIIANGFTK